MHNRGVGFVRRCSDFGLDSTICYFGHLSQVFIVRNQSLRVVALVEDIRYRHEHCRSVSTPQDRRLWTSSRWNWTVPCFAYSSTRACIRSMEHGNMSPRPASGATTTRPSLPLSPSHASAVEGSGPQSTLNRDFVSTLTLLAYEHKRSIPP